jgi:hypothetical protein
MGHPSFVREPGILVPFLFGSATAQTLPGLLFNASSLGSAPFLPPTAPVDSRL